jgi:murein DD-endopeptidase MepM/ murein hydrolase activator NlpD
MQGFCRSFFLSVLLSIFFLNSANLFAIQAPWSIPHEIKLPWGGTSGSEGGGYRQEARESWFRGLNWGQAFKSKREDSQLTNSQLMAARELAQRERRSAQENASAKSNENDFSDSRSDIPDHSDLSEIPWQAYQEEFPTESFKAKLMWPVEGGKLSSGYGFRNGKVHEGLDISAPMGNSIRAVADGRVVYSGSVSGYGKLMVVYHGHGIASVYAHNSLNLKARGTRIRQGETIARIGRSGDATGAHCHFEIRENGKPTNPLRFTYIQSPLFAQR